MKAPNPHPHERLVYGLATPDWQIRFYLQSDPAASGAGVHYTVTRLESGDNPPPFGSTLDIADPHWTGGIGNAPVIRLWIGESPKPIPRANARRIWAWCMAQGFRRLEAESVVHTQNAF